MNGSGKTLKVISLIVSGLLAIAALIFLILSPGNPKQAEAVLEYTAPPGFNPAGLTSALEALRNDQGFLLEVAIRGNFTKSWDPKRDEKAAKLGNLLTFEPKSKEPAVSIRFAHPKAPTALNVAYVAAAVAKERLESQQQQLAKEILGQEDAVEDKRKLLEQIRQIEALPAGDPRKKSGWNEGYSHFVDPQNDYECSIQKLDELRARILVSIRPIRAATLTSEQ
ncbi:hypothetical protein [Luteolibacter soli]|uniref:DUF541 domain-containing protein n=1 Tax=Luteolibacter soli TaxID=3135280 RepID=A0ABU9ANA9_9BACT